MEKITNKLSQMYLKAYVNSKSRLNSIKERLCSEDGDTNFLSIIIVLAIVLVVAGVFIIFKDQILGFFSEAWEKFIEVFNGSEKDPNNIIHS